jgi:integrase
VSQTLGYAPPWPGPWKEYRHYAINVLAAATGIRMGEVRALLVENVRTDHVEIRRSWEEGYGPRPPKADSVRDVPISPKVHTVLERVIQETEPQSLFFYGRAGKDTPMSKSVIEGHLSRAMSAIGIPPGEQRKRSLTFHGWRHFLNTVLCSNGVADAKTRRITGHRTESMTSWYTHWKALDISEVVETQTAPLEGPPG